MKYLILFHFFFLSLVSMGQNNHDGDSLNDKHFINLHNDFFGVYDSDSIYQYFVSYSDDSTAFTLNFLSYTGTDTIFLLRKKKYFLGCKLFNLVSLSDSNYTYYNASCIEYKSKRDLPKKSTTVGVNITQKNNNLILNFVVDQGHNYSNSLLERTLVYSLTEKKFTKVYTSSFSEGGAYDFGW